MLQKRRILPLVALLASLVAPHVSAAPLKILGFRDGSCQAWGQSKDDPEQRQRFVSWARGFLSGHNYANQHQQVTDVSSATVELYIDRYCREKPAAQFTDAVYRMSDDYAGRSAPMTK